MLCQNEYAEKTAFDRHELLTSRRKEKIDARYAGTKKARRRRCGKLVLYMEKYAGTSQPTTLTDSRFNAAMSACESYGANDADRDDAI